MSKQEVSKEWKKLGIGANINNTELNMKLNLVWILRQEDLCLEATFLVLLNTRKGFAFPRGWWHTLPQYYLNTSQYEERRPLLGNFMPLNFFSHICTHLLFLLTSEMTGFLERSNMSLTASNYIRSIMVGNEDSYCDLLSTKLIPNPSCFSWGTGTRY